MVVYFLSKTLLGDFRVFSYTYRNLFPRKVVVTYRPIIDELNMSESNPVF